MTWVGILNMVLFQFLFIRLARTMEYTSDWNDQPRFYGFRFMYWVKPFTGWNISPYKFIGKSGARFTKYIYKAEWTSRLSRITSRTSTRS